MDANIKNLLLNLVELILDAVVVVDIDGKIVYANHACERIFGYKPEELIGQAMIDHVAPEDRLRTLKESRQVMAGYSRVGFENRYIRKDGRYVHIMWSARWLESNQLRIGVARDVTELKHAEAIQAATYAVSEAAQHATDLRTLFEHVHRIILKLVPLSGFAAVVYDFEAKKFELAYQVGLQNCLPMVRHSVAILNSTRDGFLDPATSEQNIFDLPCAGPAALNTDDICCLDLLMDRPRRFIGKLFLETPSGTVYGDEDKELLRYLSAQVATAIDRMQLHARLQHSALHDELTGLPNRRLLLEQVQSALARCQRQLSRMALLFVDIDGLKQINDVFGHAVGDRFLQEIAQRLKNSRRQVDIVSRLGGDEFVVLLQDIHQREDAVAVENDIHVTLSRPMTIDGHVVVTGASVGIAMYPEDGIDSEQLLSHADKNMYKSKLSKRSPHL